MKSIRSAALSEEKEETLDYPKNGYLKPYDKDYYGGYGSYYGTPQKASLFDPYKSEYDYMEVKEKPVEPGQINVKIFVEFDELGNLADFSSEEFNQDEAENKAVDIANDRLYALCNPAMLADYRRVSECTEGIDEYEVTFTLTPK